jgi:hypothetical protein
MPDLTEDETHLLNRLAAPPRCMHMNYNLPLILKDPWRWKCKKCGLTAIMTIPDEEWLKTQTISKESE